MSGMLWSIYCSSITFSSPQHLGKYIFFSSGDAYYTILVDYMYILKTYTIHFSLISLLT